LVNFGEKGKKIEDGEYDRLKLGFYRLGDEEDEASVI
jgi:hypothetical protein